MVAAKAEHLQDRLKIWLPALRAGTGVDVFVERLAAGLAKAGHEPIVQWFPRHFEFTPWRLKKIVPPQGIDLVHAASWQGFAYKRPWTPLVVTEHHYVGHPQFVSQRSFAQQLYHQVFVSRWLARSYVAADELVAVSVSTAQAMERDFSRSISVVLNWVDTSQFSPGPGVSRQVSHKPFRLLFVGNPSRRKGSDLLPDLAHKLGEKFELICLGGLRDNLKLANTPPNLVAYPRTYPAAMPDIYRNVDAIVVLARYEAFGYVALEAMSCGVPVLGFDTTGTSEICIHGETALLAPVGDIDELVRFARQLDSEPDLRTRLGLAGRKRALDYFGEAHAIAQYIEIYANAIAKARPKSHRTI